MTGDSRMTEERFSALVDAYGANPDRWPDEERTAAIAFRDGSLAAQAAAERAGALDGLLDAARPNGDVSDDLRDRIARLAPARTAAPSIPLWQAARKVGASWQRIAATALVGIAVGILFAELALSPGDDSALLASAIPEPGMLTAELEAPLAGGTLLAEIALAPDLSAVSFTGIEGTPAQQRSEPSAVTQLLDDGIGSVADLPLL
jgi:hypothetical protein